MRRGSGMGGQEATGRWGRGKWEEERSEGDLRTMKVGSGEGSREEISRVRRRRENMGGGERGGRSKEEGGDGRRFERENGGEKGEVERGFGRRRWDGEGGSNRRELKGELGWRMMEGEGGERSREGMRGVTRKKDGERQRDGV